MSRKVLILGDSLTVALNQGYRQLKSAGTIPAGVDLSIRPLCGGAFLKTPFFVEKEGVAHMVADEAVKNFPQLPLPGENPIYGFCGSLHTTRVLRGIDWSNHAPAEVATSEVPISSALFEAIVEDDQKYILAFLDVLLGSGARLFVIESPRPFRHHPMFACARPEVLLHVDRAYRNFVRRELDRRNVPVIAVPEACIDPQGAMLDVYKHPNEKDFHHGNEAFGALMMAEVVAHVVNSVTA